jgi:type I restriction enzyme S subunit
MYYPEAKALNVCVPAKRHQEAIAGVLGALDEKIEANRNAVKAAESLAVSLVVHTRGVTTIRTIAEPTSHMLGMAIFRDQEVEHFSLPAFDSGCLPIIGPGENVKSGKFLLTTPSVLVSKLNPRIPRVWMARPSGQRMAITSTEFVCLVPIGDCPVEVIWSLCASTSVISHLAERAKGTTGSHQRVSADDVLALRVSDPRLAGVGTRETVVASVRLVASLRDESACLAALRDALLPKLLSGELRVREAESLVEEAV